MVVSVRSVCRRLASSEGCTVIADDEEGQLEKVLKSRRDLFTYHKNGRQGFRIYLKLYLCKKHTQNDGQCEDSNCQYIHICTDYLFYESCDKKSQCCLGHSIKSARNNKVLRKFGIIDSECHEIKELMIKIAERFGSQQGKNKAEQKKSHGDNEGLEMHSERGNDSESSLKKQSGKPTRRKGKSNKKSESNNNPHKFMTLSSSTGEVVTPQENEELEQTKTQVEYVEEKEKEGFSMHSEVGSNSEYSVRKKKKNRRRRKEKSKNSSESNNNTALNSTQSEARHDNGEFLNVSAKNMLDVLLLGRGSYPAQRLAELLYVSCKELYEMVLSWPDIVSLNISEKSNDLEVKLNLEGCVDYMKQSGCEKEDCDKIHLCAAYVKGMCQLIECQFEHEIRSPHNCLILKKFGFKEESSDSILSLFSEIPGFWVIPSICEDYENGDCENEICEYLHICPEFLLGKCDDTSKCKVENHDILSVQCQHCLHCAGVPYSLSFSDLVFHANRMMRTDRRVIITDLVKALGKNMGIQALKSLSHQSRIPLSQLNSLLIERPDLFLISSTLSNEPVVSLNIELCHDYLSGRPGSGCSRVHLCNLFLYGKCLEDEMCITDDQGKQITANHIVKTADNIAVFRRFGLRHMDEKEIVIILMLNRMLRDLSSRTLLSSSIQMDNICWEYFSGQCNKQDCRINLNRIFQAFENDLVSAQELISVLRHAHYGTSFADSSVKEYSLRLCSESSDGRICQNTDCKKLHVCFCKKSFCTGNHQIKAHLNEKILSEHGLLDLNDSELLKVIAAASQVRNIPKVCLAFNQGSCSGLCGLLHVCIKNIFGLCFNRSCAAAPHELCNKEVQGVLNAYGIPMWTTHKDLICFLGTKMKYDPETEDLLYRDVIHKIVASLARNNYEMTYGDLLSSTHISEDSVLDAFMWQPDLFNHNSSFELDSLISLPLEICYLSNCLCDKLHVCCNFIWGLCKNSLCMINHNLKSKQNSKFFNSRFLENLTQKQLKELIVFNLENNPPPSLCVSFNYGSCSNNGCCQLHACLADVIGACDATQCWLPHLTRESGFDFLLQDLSKREAVYIDNIRQFVEDFDIYARVASYLQLYEGEATLSELADKLCKEADVLEGALTRNKMSYTLDNTSDGETRIRFNLSVCSYPSCQSKKCEKLHICWQDLCGVCNNGEKCSESHNFETDSNVKILQKSYLGKVRVEVVKKIILKLCQLIPSICLPYNLGNCTSTDSACRSLHICVRPLLSLADTNCPAENHSISASHCKSLLKSHKKLTSMNESHLLFLTKIQAVRQNMMQTLKTYEFAQNLAEKVACAGGVKDFDLSVHGNLLQETVSIYPRIFSSAVTENSVKLRLKLHLCQLYVSHQGCNRVTCGKIHLCKGFLGKSCERSDCRFSHTIKSSYNMKIFQQFRIDLLSDDLLLQLVSNLSGNFVTPGVCLEYNRGVCTDNGTCKEFHVCLWMMDGECDERFCKNLNHDITAPQCAQLLESYKIPMNQSKKELMSCIWKNTKGKSNAGDYLKLTRVGCFRAHVYQEGNVPVQEICLDHLDSECSSDRCPRLHCELPFHWQIQSPAIGAWFNLSKVDSDIIEKKFVMLCLTTNVRLPGLHKDKMASILSLGASLATVKSWNIYFRNDDNRIRPVGCEVNSHLRLNIRRVSTVSSAFSYHKKATKWLWYVQRLENAWELHSSDIEAEYYSGKSSVAYIDSHCIDFRNMAEINHATGQQYRLLRRPESNIETVTTSVPDACKMLEPGEDFKLVELDSKSFDYRSVMWKIGNDSPRRFRPAVFSIKRVINRHLQEAYEIRKRNLSTTLGAAPNKPEKLLFRSVTSSSWLAACKENFDSRVKERCDSGRYGAGVYFYKSFADAHESSEKEAPSAYIIVSQVLVGNLMKGDNTIIRPPTSLSNPTSVIDTTVDDSLNPTIFVKFLPQDFCPKYVVEYMLAPTYKEQLEMQQASSVKSPKRTAKVSPLITPVSQPSVRKRSTSPTYGNTTSRRHPSSVSKVYSTPVRQPSVRSTDVTAKSQPSYNTTRRNTQCSSTNQTSSSQTEDNSCVIL